MGMKRPPGPRGSLLFGNVSEIRQDPLGLLERCRRDYGDAVWLRLGPLGSLVVFHPDLISRRCGSIRPPT
jgi:hypothetical protein